METSSEQYPKYQEITMASAANIALYYSVRYKQQFTQERRENLELSTKQFLTDLAHELAATTAPLRVVAAIIVATGLRIKDIQPTEEQITSRTEQFESKFTTSLSEEYANSTRE